MKTPLTLLLTLSVAIANLTGCSTYSLWQNKETKPKEHRIYDKEKFEDNLIAIGTPKQPVEGFDDALVLVGEKYSYLMISDDAEHNQTHIFKTMLLTMNPKDFTLINDEIKASGDKSNVYHQYKTSPLIKLNWQKPLNNVTPSERSLLNESSIFGFSCDNKENDTEGKKAFIYQCSGAYSAILMPIPNTTNIGDLPYRFPKPIKLTLSQYESQTYQSNPNTQKAGKMLITPLAVAVDVVTLPIQAIMGIHAIKEFHVP